MGTARYVVNETKSLQGRAAQWPIEFTGPAPRFMEGALLGNGGLGAVVTTRSDSIVIHLGHNAIWDERVDEAHAPLVRTFAEVFARVQQIDPTLDSLDDDDWYRKYRSDMERSYAKPFPRPFPCGSIVLGFSRRTTELIGHSLDIQHGVCTVSLLHNGEPVSVRIWVDQGTDVVWVDARDELDTGRQSPFNRVRLLPDPDGPAEDGARALTPLELSTTLAASGGMRAQVQVEDMRAVNRIRFSETLPHNPGAEAHSYEVELSSSATLSDGERMNWDGVMERIPTLEGLVDPDAALLVAVTLSHGPLQERAERAPRAATAEADACAASAESSAAEWDEYWGRSSIALSSAELEAAWYHGTYFSHCALRPGATCPGIFGNWSYRQVGTAWHGDYHLNYNTQQPFWGVFSSNRVESHLPYVDLVHDLLPLSRHWAESFYELEGAYFPHSAYPVPMSTMPYPSPSWGWEICETPWAVQSLWWHYQFTGDLEFLRDRAFVPLREATKFLVAYIERPDARGERFGDDRWHIFPTVPPELYSLRPGFTYNADCLTDLTLTRFVLKAFQSSCQLLGDEVSAADKALVPRVQAVLDHLPDYPTAPTDEGAVFVATPDSHADTVYNVPVPAMSVFPGEDHSWESDPETVETLRRTLRLMDIEGGNDLVFANLQAVRLGILDVQKFARQLQYCAMPNGSYTDMVLQSHGRYDDSTAPDFMAEMGVWVENFAVTSVINECLLQSYSPTIRVFPNCEGIDDARFESLRAVGAFLVSAERVGGETRRVEVLSERGGELRIQPPWTRTRVESDAGSWISEGESAIVIETAAGQRVLLSAAE